MTELIEINNELFEDLNNFKKLIREFEIKLNRTTNCIDIIGEMEVSRILELKMVRNIIHPGFDAYDGKERVQIKATRAKGNNSRVSTLLKKGDALDFDYAILIKYVRDSDFVIEGLYKASQLSIRRHFDYINSSERIESRNGKRKNDMAISEFMRYSEFVYDFDHKGFINNKGYRPSSDRSSARCS